MINDKALKKLKIDKLRSEIIDNNVCPELATNASILVMGDGNLDADILFIGEAPGKKEDQQGIPFVGASGKFVDEMLSSINLFRSDVYITNIVKYRPPNNRDPTTHEKKAFEPYLTKQIQIIKPKLIITLGRHSMDYFLPGLKISEVHGLAHNIEFVGGSILVVPLYHPAAALYNGSLRQTLMDDFLSLPNIIKQL